MDRLSKKNGSEFKMKYIKRKSLLYKTNVEYGDYTINHIQGCSHGCLYPCYAFNMAKRFGKIKTYEEWLEPSLVTNSLELLDREIPKHISDIKSIHLCFMTDPFMYGFNEIKNMSIDIIKKINSYNIKCNVLTKGILPIELKEFYDDNEYGITLISLSDEYKNKYEPFAAPIKDRLDSLYQLHQNGCYTWVSMEPYPTPNIIEQNINEILDAISFVDKIIFGRLNYNSIVREYVDYKKYYNELSNRVIEFCENNNIAYHIKDGTIS